MEFTLERPSYQTMSQWYIWRLGVDMAQYVESIPPELSADKMGDFLATQRLLECFFQDLLVDLYDNPLAYRLPEQPYEAYTEERLRKQNDVQRQERIRAAIVKAKIVETGWFNFLYQLGRAGVVAGQDLLLKQAFFEQLIKEKIKKTGHKAFFEGFKRLGFEIVEGEPVRISNNRYPGLMSGLSSFAKACAATGEPGFYFFRRCDFGVYNQKCLPAFKDALRLAPELLRNELQKTDEVLTQHKFKREILVSEAWGGYRFRYNKKNDKIVYWVRLMSWFSPPFHHNLRWPFESAVTPGLFTRLDAVKPGLADRIFEGIKKCEHDYENCIARVIIARGGQAQECCSEVAWDTIGDSPADFENLRLVLGILDELVSGKKN